MSIEKITKLFPEASFSHSCIVVSDIEKTYENYKKIPGAELSVLKRTNDPDIAKVVYRGQSTPTIARQFFVTIGGLRIEVLSPDEHPSVWAEILARQGGDSLHHIGFDVDDSAPVIKFFDDMGMGVLQTGNYLGGRYIYLDTKEAFGMIIELLETV